MGVGDCCVGVRSPLKNSGVVCVWACCEFGLEARGRILEDYKRAVIKRCEDAYEVTLGGSAFLTCERVATDIRDRNVGVDRQLGLKGDVGEGQPHLSERTLKT